MPTTQEASTSKTPSTAQAQDPIHRGSAGSTSGQKEETFATVTVKMYRLKLPEVRLTNGHLITPGQIGRLNRELHRAASKARADYGVKLDNDRKKAQQASLDAAKKEEAARKKALREARLADAKEQQNNAGKKKE